MKPVQPTWDELYDETKRLAAEADRLRAEVERLRKELTLCSEYQLFESGERDE